MATFDPARLSAVELTPLDSVGFRNQAPGFDARSGEGARRFGGRYNPPSSFPAIYLCLTRLCVVAELSARAGHQNVQIGDLLPRELWSVNANLERVLDLTNTALLAALEIEVGDLVRADHTFTREIGEAAHERGVQAIRAPSATGVDQVLAILPENLGTQLRVELVEVWSSLEDLPSA